jgi:hypothetical protein
MMNEPQPEGEIEPISPEDARIILEAAIQEQLGANWQQEWMLVHDGDYLMRLHQGAINLDFAVDLLGNLTVEERPANPVQLSGRLVAWLVLGAFLFVALAIASLAGVI